MDRVSDTKGQVARAIRFVASGGWSTEDPDVMAELLERAERLAQQVVADAGSSPEVRASAEEFLERLKLDLSG
jgi:hypothetical protein